MNANPDAPGGFAAPFGSVFSSQFYMIRRIEQLRQLKTITWDGDVIDSASRDDLVKHHLVRRECGWNYLTSKGIRCLVTLGLLMPGKKSGGPKK